MESTGKAGAIQVTHETCEILQTFGYTFEQRGLVAVKGKGQLMTYYLIVSMCSENELKVSVFVWYSFAQFLSSNLFQGCGKRHKFSKHLISQVVYDIFK